MLDKRETILVTGATGFIGGWIVEALHLSGFTRVRAGIRGWSGAARVARFPVELVQCDVMSADETLRAVDGAEIVIHCAKGDGKTNIEGTRNVLAAAAHAGIRSLVHLSTAEVYGNATGLVDETCPLKYSGDEYADSKIEAEKLCREFFQRQVPVSIFRPSIVYGPFSEWWVVRLSQCLRSGNWGTFQGYGEGLCNLIYVSDLVSAILLAAESTSAPGEAFNVNGPEKITWNQYFASFNSGLGLPELRMLDPRVSKLRAALTDPLRGAGSMLLKRFRDPIMRAYQSVVPIRTAVRLAKRSVQTTPSVHELNLYGRNAYYSDAKARKLLGYHPATTIGKGVQLVVDWLALQGYAPEPPAVVEDFRK